MKSLDMVQLHAKVIFAPYLSRPQWHCKSFWNRPLLENVTCSFWLMITLCKQCEIVTEIRELLKDSWGLLNAKIWINNFLLAKDLSSLAAVLEWGQGAVRTLWFSSSPQLSGRGASLSHTQVTLQSVDNNMQRQSNYIVSATGRWCGTL